MAELYSGAADIGKIGTIISAVIATIIALTLIIVGIVLLTRSQRISGIISIVVGATIIIIAWLIVILVQNSKPLAALSGVLTTADLIKHL